MATKSPVGEMLVRAGVLDELQLRAALARRDQWGGRVAKIISDMGLADDDRIADAIAQSAGLKRVRLGTAKDPAALAKLDAAYCEQNGVFPVRLRDSGKVLFLAMADPTDLSVIDDIALRGRVRVMTAVASEKEIAHAILRHYRHQDPEGHGDSMARRAVRVAELDSDADDLSLSDGGFTTDSVARFRPERELDAGELEPGTESEEWSEDQRARIVALRTNQQRSAIILRALTELLLEKGLLSAGDLGED